MTFGDMMNQWPDDAKAPDTTPPPTDTPLPAPPSILGRTWGSLTDAAKYLANPTDIAQEDPEGPGFGKKLGEGFVRGIHDVADAPSVWALKQLGVGDTAAQRVQDERKKFEDQYGDSSVASVGRIAGQTLATAPVLAGGGAALGAGARAIGAPALTTALDVLNGAYRASPEANIALRLGARGGSLAAQGGTQGAAIGAMTADPSQSTADAALQGATTGAVAGPVIGAATYPLRAAVNALRGYLPNMIDIDLAGWAQKAKALGIDIDPSQLTANKTYQLVADQTGKLPFSGASAAINNSRLQAQQAVARVIGEDAPNGITFDVANRARQRIGAVFDEQIPNASINANGEGFLNGLAKVEQEALAAFNGDRTAPEFQKIMGKINQLQGMAVAGDGTISGEAAQAYTKTGSPFDRMRRGDQSSTVQSYLGDIRDVVNNSLEGRTPEGQAALDQAKGQWAALKTIEPLVQQKGASGDLNLSGLKQQVIKQNEKFGNLGYAYGGGGPLRDLGEIGQRFFPTLPETGSGARGVTLGLAAGVGGGVGAALSHPWIPAAVAGGLAANRYALQPFLHSPTVGSNMIRNTLNPNAAGPTFQRALPYTIPGLLGISNSEQGE